MAVGYRSVRHGLSSTWLLVGLGVGGWMGNWVVMLLSPHTVAHWLPMHVYVAIWSVELGLSSRWLLVGLGGGMVGWLGDWVVGMLSPHVVAHKLPMHVCFGILVGHVSRMCGWFGGWVVGWFGGWVVITAHCGPLVAHARLPTRMMSGAFSPT